MRLVRVLLSRLAGAVGRNHAESDLREELEAHLQMETDEYVRRGMSPADARRKALLASGGLTTAAESVREQRGLPFVENIVADFRYALRALGRSRAFTAVVIITLALGIGASTAVFSVVRGVLLKPLPHRDGDRLMYLRQAVDGHTQKSVPFSVPEVADIRQGVPAFEGVAEYSPWFHTLAGDSSSIRMDVALVSGNFFEVMGLRPALGRLIRPSDDGGGAPPVIVLTHEFWLARYHGDSSIVGRQVTLDGRSVTVIGVVQAAPFFPDRVDALLNLVNSPHHLSAQMVQNRSHRMTELIARLAPGATVDLAQSQLAAVHDSLQREFKSAYAASHYSVAVVPFRSALAERARMPLWLLIGAAAFVMLITVANGINLTLMRGVRREPEFVVRSALGAGVLRLRRLLLAENLVLAFAGGAFGTAIAFGGVNLLVPLAARYSPRATEVRFDLVSLAFALGTCIAVALLLSFAAFVPSGKSLAKLLSAGVNRRSTGADKQRLQRTLVVAQIAVSVVLLAGAGLLARAMISLSEVSTGLRTEQILTIAIPLLNPSDVNPLSDARLKELYERMQHEIRALPHVVEVGVGSTMPLRVTPLEFDVRRDGSDTTAPKALPHADFRTASAEYFRASGIPLLAGREFAPNDRMESDRVVIVNQTFVDRYFSGEDPIGRRIAWTGDVLRFTPVADGWRTIVGVTGDTQDGGLDAAPRAVVFAPFAQEIAMLGGLVIRTDGDAATLIPAVSRIVRRLAPSVATDNIMTIAQIKDESVAPRRLNALVIAVFGIVAMTIAAVGIAGVLAFSVSARTNEIAVRMSLGAAQNQVQRMILGEGTVLLFSGLVIGTVAAYFAARVIRGLLFDVAPYDPVTLSTVVVVMGAIGIFACWIPARRAARVDPALTVRS